MADQRSLLYVTHAPIYANQQAVTFTTVSGSSSSAFPTGTNTIRISANTAIWYAIGVSASAGAGCFLPANSVEYVSANGAVTINVLGVTTAGTAWMTPCSE